LFTTLNIPDGGGGTQLEEGGGDCLEGASRQREPLTRFSGAKRCLFPGTEWGSKRGRERSWNPGGPGKRKNKH